MKIAVILHGNLRTFFMPVRDGSGMHVCDLLHNNVVLHNDADVFIVTDTTDFYHNGVQYFDDVQKPDLVDAFGRYLDPACSMFYDTIGYINSTDAQELLNHELLDFFGSSLKNVSVLDVYNVCHDTKYKLLAESKASGCIPERLVNQYAKIKHAYDTLIGFENETGVHYDIIFRGRLDNLYGPYGLDISSYNFNEFDMYGPGIINDNLVYDWCAFGTRKSMDVCLGLYDNLGFTLDNKIPGSDDFIISSEHHLSRLLKDNNIRYTTAGYPMSPYRYRDEKT